MIRFIASMAFAFSAVVTGTTADSASPAAKPIAVAQDAEQTSVDQNSKIDNFARLKREMAKVRETYSAWGLRRKIQTHATIADVSTEDRTRTIDWSRQSPIQTVRDDFLRSADWFRSERLEPSAQKQIYAYDGRIGRVRDVQGVANVPLRNIVNAYERNLAPNLPHGVLVESYYSRHVNWLHAPVDGKQFFPRETIIDRAKIEEAEWSGHPCWKVVWRSVNNEELDIITSCVAYLARDRSLLPIRQEFETPYENGDSEIKAVETDEFQLDSSTDRWFPRLVTASRRWNSELQVTRVSFELDDRYRDESVYSDAPAITAEHLKPPSAIVAKYSPPDLLTQLSGISSTPLAVRYALQTQTAGGGTIGLVLFLVTISIWFKTARLGRSLRQYLGRHRTMMGATGITLTACVGYLCSHPPGWIAYGLAMMFVGLFGIGWIGFTMVLLGDKQVSIRMALFAAACTALCFGGYSKGIKRMQVRQRMISEVRDGGGRVEMGLWHLDEVGLYLPARLRSAFGEAWSGRASRAAIAYESFTKENVENWCLDEVKWLGLASMHGEPFEVDGKVIAEIDDTEVLWTLDVEGGYLGSEALAEVSRFSCLIDLHYDCQHRPVAKEIALIPQLERVWLTNAVVDDALVETLRKVENLDYVTLITPRFGKCDRAHLDLGIEGVEVQYTTLTPEAINTLGQLSTKLVFVDCNVKLPASTEVTLPWTTALTFHASDLRNDSLLKLSKSPKLVSVDLTRTDVSIDGMEAFSQRRPEVAIVLSSR